MKKLGGMKVGPTRPWGDDLSKFPAQAAIRISQGLKPRSNVDRALREWQENIIVDLGGADAVTTAQRELVAIASRTKLFLDSVDLWLIGQKNLTDTKKKGLIPALVQRSAIAGQLADLLTKIGVEKRARPTMSLAEIMASSPSHSRGDAAPPGEPKGLTVETEAQEETCSE